MKRITVPNERTPRNSEIEGIEGISECMVYLLIEDSYTLISI